MDSLRGYDDWKTLPLEPKVYGQCPRCKGDLHNPELECDCPQEDEEETSDDD